MLYVNYRDKLTESLKSINPKKAEEFVKLVESFIKKRKTIFFAGNGGSASTASHMAADLSKNTVIKPKPRTISLCDNISYITAVGNDDGYDQIFSDQLVNLAQKGDLLIVISGSGNSLNIIKAVKEARKIGVATVGILGFDGGKVKKLLDFYLLCKNTNYGIIESVHSFVHHFLVESFKK